MGSQFLTLEQGIALIVASSVLAYVLGAVTSRFAARLSDIIWKRARRVYRAFIRLIGIETRAARSAVATAKSRGLVYLTDLDAALRVIDSSSNEESPEESPALYDFSLEESLLKREGGFFRCIRIPPESGYIPDSLTKKMTDAVSDENVKEAAKFFNHNVPLHVNETSLYDDVEGAVIVSFFRNSDRRCFYALNEMRKTINGNIWRMVWSFSAIWVFAAAALVWLFWGESSGGLKPLSDQFWVIESPSELVVVILAVVKPAAALMVVIAAASAIIVFQASGYQKQQEHSARELGWFLSRWLDRLNDRYRDAIAHAKGVTVGEEKDSKKVAEAARRWCKTMMWMAFRSFFIESFYRNIRFQIDRNRSYYDIGPAFVLIIGAITLFFAYWNFPGARPSDLVTSGVLLVLMSFITFIYWHSYHKLVIPRELDESKWLGFQNLELNTAIDDVVGKYGEEVGYWKNRTGRVQ